MKRFKSAKHEGFTIIELLAVMTIMVIITGITIIGFTGLTRGAATAGAARNVQATIKLARQYAITQRIPVAFIICDPDIVNDHAAISVTDENEHLIGRSYAVFDMNSNRYIKPWTELPRGTIFMNGDANTLGINLPDGRHILQPPRNISQLIPFPADYSPNYASFYGIVFTPDGKMSYSGVGDHFYVWVLLFEGSIAADGSARRRGEDVDGAHSIVYGIKVTHAGGTQMIEFN